MCWVMMCTWHSAQGMDISEIYSTSDPSGQNRHERAPRLQGAWSKFREDFRGWIMRTARKSPLATSLWNARGERASVVPWWKTDGTKTTNQQDPLVRESLFGGFASELPRAHMLLASYHFGMVISCYPVPCSSSFLLHCGGTNTIGTGAILLPMREIQSMTSPRPGGSIQSIVEGRLPPYLGGLNLQPSQHSIIKE